MNTTIPRKFRARLLRIYTRSLITGHYQRHNHPNDNYCRFCFGTTGTKTPETLAHLFHDCPFAVSMWSSANLFWPTQSQTPMPSCTHAHITGDVSHIPDFDQNPALTHIWQIIHASTTSRIYLERNDMHYKRPPYRFYNSPPHLTPLIRSDVRAAVRADWLKFGGAKGSGHEGFAALWKTDFGDFFTTIERNENDDDDDDGAGRVAGHFLTYIDFTLISDS